MNPSTRTLLGISINLLLIIAVQAAALIPVSSYAQDDRPPTFLLQHNVWEQLVLPGNPAGETIGSLFGDALDVNDYGKTWVVYTYDPAGLSYANPGIGGTVNQAQAFWITQRTGVSVELGFPANFPDARLTQSAVCNSSASCAEIALTTISGDVAWTMAGSPFKDPVPAEQINVVTDSVGSSCIAGCSLAEAAAVAYTGNEFWGYESATSTYVDQKSMGSFKPLQGFWVSALPAADWTNPVVLLPDPGSPPDDSLTGKLPGVPHTYIYEGNEIFVNNGTELLSAISDAQPGDIITLSPGLFLVGHKISLIAEGSASNPITIRAADVRNTEINFSHLEGIVEGFTVRGKHWIIDGFVMSSDCEPAQHSLCEHAIHIKNNATGLIIRNNKIIDFNAAIKGSGSDNLYADYVRIEHNEIFNTSVRNTSNPVTPIDINGGDSWLISKNSIYDFAKGLGNKVSYGAFLKANSSNGVMDSNRLQCQKMVAAPGARIGLSFGGGGNSPINSPICKDSDCSHLHRNGRMSNNVITNCSDVGIYINASSNTLIDHNTLFSTTGIDIRFETSTARVIANILVDGSIRERQGGQVIQNEANVLRSKADIPSLPELINAIAPHTVADPQLNYDICGYQRQTTFIGAIGGTEEERGVCLTGML